MEAFDANGTFDSHVPFHLTVIDPRGVVVMRPEGDYLEALAAGEASFEVTWACGPNDGPGVQSRIRVIVTE